jgi:hypothetical protein
VLSAPDHVATPQFRERLGVESQKIPDAQLREIRASIFPRDGHADGGARISSALVL